MLVPSTVASFSIAAFKEVGKRREKVVSFVGIFLDPAILRAASNRQLRPNLRISIPVSSKFAKYSWEAFATKPDPNSIAPTDRPTLLLLSQTSYDTLLLETQMSPLRKQEVWQGTLALMVLKTLESLGPLHGYGIARRIEQTSADLLAINQGTLYPVLLTLEQTGAIAAEWGTSENNRKAKFYSLTKAGQRQLAAESREWQSTTAIIARFFQKPEPGK